jgi:hypothetical protein
MMRFGLITPTFVIEREEMPRARIFNLIVDHVPDDRKAGEAIAMISVTGSGSYEGEGWLI